MLGGHLAGLLRAHSGNETLLHPAIRLGVKPELFDPPCLMRIKVPLHPRYRINHLYTASTMNLFSSTRTKRRIAFAVLVVWLFAVASGIANACLLEVSKKPGAHAHGAMAASSHAGDPAAVLAGSVEAGDGHDDDSHTSAPPCLKVCDDGSTALLKLQAGVHLSDPGMPPLVAVVWNAAAPVVSGPCWRVDLQPPPAGPPFRHRYCRLAL